MTLPFEILLQTDIDVYESMAEKVSLMTIHAAKGLEFPVVFIVGCEQDIIPLRRKEYNSVDLEEERRLLYVAMTRAERQLYLTWARNRLVFGKKMMRHISPFVSDIDSCLVQKQEPVVGKRKKGPTQLKLF